MFRHNPCLLVRVRVEMSPIFHIFTCAFNLTLTGHIVYTSDFVFAHLDSIFALSPLLYMECVLCCIWGYWRNLWPRPAVQPSFETTSKNLSFCLDRVKVWLWPFCRRFKRWQWMVLKMEINGRVRRSLIGGAFSRSNTTLKTTEVQLKDVCNICTKLEDAQCMRKFTS